MTRIKTQVLRTLSAVFLLGYLLNVVSLESLHHLAHHHEDHSELHSVHAEADACHRAIYHGDDSNECQHKSHVSKTESACELCQVITSRCSQFLSSAEEWKDDHEICSHEFSLFSDAVLDAAHGSAALRGPPTN